MRLLILTLLIIVCFSKQQLNTIEEMKLIFKERILQIQKINKNKNQQLTPQYIFIQNNLTNSKYDKCIFQLEKTLDQVLEITRKLIDKDYEQIINLAFKFITGMIDTVDCFKYPPDQIIQNKQQCISDHLRSFANVMRQMLRDMWEKKFDKASTDLQKGIEIIKDMLVSC